MPIPENELCANCGTDLDWWKKVKNGRVYVDDSGTYYCSKKCFKEYQAPTLKEVRICEE